MTTQAEKVAHARDSEQIGNHTCHWPGCPLQVKPAFWGCSTHWFKLPQRLRNRIWKTYRPGQEIDKEPSRAYLEVASDVQRWIATQVQGSSVAADADTQLGERMSAAEHKRENS